MTSAPAYGFAVVGGKVGKAPMMVFAACERRTNFSAYCITVSYRPQYLAQTAHLLKGLPFSLLTFSNSFPLQQFNFFLELLILAFRAGKLLFKLCKASFSTFLLIVFDAGDLMAQSGADVAFRHNGSLGTAQRLQWRPSIVQFDSQGRGQGSMHVVQKCKSIGHCDKVAD